MTEAEKLLWSRIRSRQLSGYKFRRQHPIGVYIVDFFCPDLNLVIEVDGGQHADNLGDEKRDAWLSSEGYRILRYWNNQILKETESVLKDILQNIGSPSPGPSPQGREES
jgi:very-short-patch-repair endonuclease